MSAKEEWIAKVKKYVAVKERERKLVLQSLRQWGERAEAAETEIRSYCINVWTVKRGASVRRPSGTPWRSFTPKAKRLSTLGVLCWPIHRRTTGRTHQANKYFSYLCVCAGVCLESPGVPTPTCGHVCIYMCAALTHIYTNVRSSLFTASCEAQCGINYKCEVELMNEDFFNFFYFRK